MSTGMIELIAVVAVALGFDLMNGFHDGCNAVSTVIYTGALKPRFAIALSALFNFIGPLIMGVAVAKTIGGIIQAGDASAPAPDQRGRAAPSLEREFPRRWGNSPEGPSPSLGRKGQSYY